MATMAELEARVAALEAERADYRAVPRPSTPWARISASTPFSSVP
ncbi:hypothetical protein [Amycolatopsis aidingensis]|nr:hypothetical protein [Amycolatopsis aidingensis]